VRSAKKFRQFVSIDPYGRPLICESTVFLPAATGRTTSASPYVPAKFLFVANYFAVQSQCFRIAADGRLKCERIIKIERGQRLVRTKSVTQRPVGVLPLAVTTRTHCPYMIQSDPSGRYVFACRLGLNKISFGNSYALTGTCNGNDPTSASRLPRRRAAKFYFHSQRALGCTSFKKKGVDDCSFEYASKTRPLDACQETVCVTPRRDSQAEAISCSEILVFRDGTILSYGGNRLQPTSIGSFRSTRRQVKAGRHEWTLCSYRAVHFDPNRRGSFTVCNQRADNVTFFKSNKDTGGLNVHGYSNTPVGISLEHRVFGSTRNPACR